MKYQIRIEDQKFDVDVGDLYSLPIHVTVDGEAYEVWPEANLSEQILPKSVTQTSNESVKPEPPKVKPVEAPNETQNTPSPDPAKALLAPIPGIIIKISVQPGTEVEYGQELCVLEAMKMNNLIRAPRAGTIAVIHASEGKHVKHGDLLMEFA